MVLNGSGRSNGEQNNSKTKLIVNTSSFNGEELNNYLDLSLEIERNEQLRQSAKERRRRSKTVMANKTREELYECSYLEDDAFLNALEHQNSYVAPTTTTQTTDLDVTPNLDGLMKYFEEEVAADSGASDTSSKQHNKFKLAVAKFKCKTGTLTPGSRRKRQTEPNLPIHPKVKELRQKYECAANEPIDSPKKTKSPRFSRKSMVGHITKMFNAKISQFMHHDSDSSKYEPLSNEFSPEAKPAPKSTLAQTNIKARPRMPTYRPQMLPSPVPSPRTRRKNTQNKVNGLVAEDVFSQLSVKDKVLLYSKFINDMSKKNPNFGKQAEITEVQRELERREVTEKQGMSQPAVTAFDQTEVSGSQLIQELIGTTDHHEAEEHAPTYTPDVLETSTRVSSLTVVLKAGKNDKKKSKKNRLSSGKNCDAPKNREIRFFENINVLEPSIKRNNDQILSTLKIEMFAPPKKIRRTQIDRFNSKQLIQNLFYGWLKDKNGVDFDITTTGHEKKIIQIEPGTIQEASSILLSHGEEQHMRAVDKIFQKTIAKIETEGTTAKYERNEYYVEKAVKINTCQTSEDEGSLKQAVLEIPIPLEVKVPLEVKELKPETKNGQKKGPAPPIPTSSHPCTVEACESSASSVKHSDGEDVRSRSSNPKITTEESQEEQNGANINEGFDFAKPSKPPRKKKMRRNLTWKKDNSIVESNVIQTTDSDSDYKNLEAAAKLSSSTLIKQKKQFNHSKKSAFNNNLPQTQPQKPHESSFDGLDKLLIRTMNSPRKIKSHYTLTVISSPSPNNESDYESDMMRVSGHEMSRSCPSIMNSVDNTELQECKTASTDATLTASRANEHYNSVSQLMISYEDQGFETGSNETEGSIRKTRRPKPPRQQKKDVSVTLNASEFEEFQQRRLSNGLNRPSTENPSCFSTPIKGHDVKGAATRSKTAYQRLSFSPVSSMSTKSRRQSIYEADPRRSSVIMQVISEDHPLEQHGTSSSPNSINYNQNIFFGDNSIADTTAPASEIGNPTRNENSSVFWITAGDFCVSMDIYYNSVERLRLLYEIFSQKSSETRELHFGIDDQKFSLHDHVDNEDISKRLPRPKGSSHYWCSTGDLSVPFSGKYMTPEKVKRLFHFVRESVAESGILRFGVDRFEFSHIPEFTYSNPKLSLESNYSMLVGLQGPSNGLEGRSKYSWPHTMTSPRHSNGLKTSDLDQSEFDTDESGDMRLSSPFFGSNHHFDMASLDSNNLTSPRISETAMSGDMFSLEYENEPLDQLFIHDSSSPKQPSECRADFEKIQNKSDQRLTVPEMLQIVQNQQNKLQSIEKSTRSSASSADFANYELKKYKDSPEYVCKLQELIAEINEIGLKTGFKGCSLQQLETFKFYLNRYAGICLASCNEHMETIQNALKDKMAVQV